jgi:IS605 OrfB family transposase
VGIDVGLESFATLSNGSAIANPRFFRTDEKALKRASRRLVREVKGTAARRKRRKVVARVHERIANRRKDFAHQEARKIVNRTGIIAVEDLAVNQMVHNHCLAESISDAAWAMFIAFLSCKAAYAGRRYVRALQDRYDGALALGERQANTTTWWPRISGTVVHVTSSAVSYGSVCPCGARKMCLAGRSMRTPMRTLYRGRTSSTTSTPSPRRCGTA